MYILTISGFIISNLTEDIVVEWGREPPFDELPLKAPKYKGETK